MECNPHQLVLIFMEANRKMMLADCIIWCLTQLQAGVRKNKNYV